MKITLLSFTTICAFVGSYFMDLTADNIEQYLAIVSVSFVDGILGIIAGTKKEGFKTYKAIKVLKTTFLWITILTLLLMIELGFKGTSWLSETICAPFIVFQIISILKNASSIGYINNSVLIEILKKIDQHKN
jgi:phage-related holin